MPNSQASAVYNAEKVKALDAIRAMTQAMTQMGDEHADFHSHLADVQQRLEDVKKKYERKQLNYSVVQVTAMDPYVSPGNAPRVMAFGQIQMQLVLKKFREQEARLDSLQKETIKRVQALVNDQDHTSGDGQNTEAEGEGMSLDG